MRFSALTLLFVAASLDMFAKNRSLTDWMLLGLLMLSYPHIQFWRTCRSANALESELSHLVADAFVVGALMAATGFSLWISFAAMLGTLMDNVTNKGWTTLLETSLGFLGGSLAWIALRGFDLSLDSGLPVALFCIVGLSGYLLAMSSSGRRRHAQLRATRENLRSREAQLLTANLALENKLQENTELQRRLVELVERRTTELVATEARASRILESAADGLFGVDREGVITFVNPAGCRMFGYRPEQVIGRSEHALLHHSRQDGSPYPAEECVAHQAWREGAEARIDDETYWHADGHAVPVALATHPIVEMDEVVGAVVSVVDVSVQRAAAEAREKALVAAENLARARSEFLANMSHEIRTPMNGVLGFAQIGQLNHKDPEKARNAFEKILTSGNQLLGVVNEILDFSKMDAGKLKVEATEMSIGAALDQSIALVADRARVKGLELKLDKAPGLPPTCVSDPLRIGQVLLNLLTNAVKFTETGSVTLSAVRQDGQLIFRVTDTGIGMTADQLGYVFNPFQQADGSTTRKFGGTGLGLAICKRLAELMNGDIRVESHPGVGSTFELSLPYVEPAARAPAPANPPEAATALPEKPLAGISILLAEDNPINQMVLEVNLVDAGARLATVGDGATAVERVIADGPAAYDLVLMDIEMPIMDGYQATRRILKLAPDLPIIGQTAHALAEERDKCFAAGMVRHIAKPIDPRALVKLVLEVLAEKRRR